MPSLHRTQSRAQALVCVALFLACAIVAYPIAEIGIYDDWSYVRTAQLLGQTGHVHYNGWATAMLGWQLIPAAIFTRVFGFSFTIVRLTTLMVAASTVFLVHRCGVRSGLRTRNATFATLVMAASPLFLPLATTYMSDMYGLFATAACLYCCLRAVSASAQLSVRWLAYATLIGVVGGTARQTAWLGALVLVPSTVWILRKRREVVIAGAVFWGVTLLAIVTALHWYKQQAYAVPETFEGLTFHASVLLDVTANLVRLGLETGVLTLPALLLFVPALRSRRSLWLTAPTLLCLLMPVALHGRIHLGRFLLPTLLDGGNYLSLQGMLTTWPEHGARAVILNEPLRLVLTLAVIAGLLGVAVRVRQQLPQGDPGVMGAATWRELLLLLLPFSAAYIGLLVPRAAAFHLYDRYGLPLVMVGSLLLVRLYQERLRLAVPLWAMLPLLATGVYSVASVHDMFALFRGTEKAATELVSAGVPRQAIDGGWEYEGWTQVETSGYVHERRLHLPGDDPHPPPDPRPCPLDAWFLFPEVKPVYALAFRPGMCEGQAPFAPVSVRTWLPPGRETIYVVWNHLQ